MFLRRKLSLMGVALCLCLPFSAQPTDPGPDPAAAPRRTAQPGAGTAGYREQAVLNRTVERVWDLADVGRLDEALAAIEAVRKLMSNPELMAKLDAMKTVCVTLKETGSASPAGQAVPGPAPAEPVPNKVAATEKPATAPATATTGIVSLPTPAAERPAPAPAPKIVPAPAEPVPNKVAATEKPATAPPTATTGIVSLPTPAAERSAPAPAPKIVPPPAEPVPNKVAATEKPAAAAAAPKPPADPGGRRDVQATIDRAWQLARAGQAQDAFVMVDAAWEQATDPKEAAKLEEVRQVVAKMRVVSLTPAATPQLSATPTACLAPADFNGLLDRAWELARAGRLDDALAAVDQCSKRTRDPEQMATLDTLRTAYTTLRDTPPPPASTGAAGTIVPAERAGAAAAPPAPLAAPAGGGFAASAIWEDPRFREQFIGSYAMTAAVEPKVGDDERKVLAVLLDLMSKGQPDAALALVEKLFLPEPPALEELGVVTLAKERQEAALAAQAAQAAADAALAAKGKAGDRAKRPQAGKGASGPTADPATPAPSLYGAVGSLFGHSAKKAEAPATAAAGPGTPAVAPELQPARTILRNPSATFAFIAGNICLQKNDLDGAARWYAKAVELFPSFMRAFKNFGMVQVRRGDNEAAAASLTRALELGANDVLVYGLLGYAYGSLGNHMSAETSYRMAILLQPKNADWKLGLVRAVFGQNRFAEAAAVCGQLIADGSRDAGLWRLQANAFLALEQPLKAAQNYEYLRLRGEADIDSLNRLGDIYLKEKMIDTAVAVYLDALASFPDQSPERALRNAKMLAMTGGAEETARFMADIRTRFAERLSAEQKNELLRLQARIAMTAGDDEQQARILKEIVDLNPTDGEALMMLGDYQARKGEPEKAILCFQRAAEIKGSEAKARIRHAQLLVKQAKYQEAVPLLQVAQRLQPRDDVADYLKQVEAAAAARR